MDTKSDTAARVHMSENDAPTGLYNETSILEKTGKKTKFGGSFSSRAGLQSLVAPELRNIYIFALKSTMMQGVEQIWTDAAEISFLTAETDLKHSIFRLIKMIVADMTHQGLMNKLNHNSFRRWTQSEVLMNKLTEEVCKHPKETKPVLESIYFITVKRNPSKDEDIVKPNAQTNVSSIVSKVESTV